VLALDPAVLHDQSEDAVRALLKEGESANTGIKVVAVKSEEQQAVLAQINGLRGLLTEYGEAMPQGRAGYAAKSRVCWGRLSDRLPAIVIDALRERYARLGELDGQISQIERRLRQWQAQDSASQRIAAIPGVGLLSATAAVATMSDAKVFKSGREFAAWLGLVPRQSGTGRPSAITRHQQARRQIPSHAADPWSSEGTRLG
jgi:transposase